MEMTEKKCDIVLVSSLSKVFADERPIGKGVQKTVLQEDLVSFQLACFLKAEENEEVQIKLESPLASWIRIRSVQLAPSSYPAPQRRDSHYLRTVPGMFPDRLAELKQGSFRLIAMQWRSLWVDVETDRQTPAGVHDITITGENGNGEVLLQMTTQVEVLPVSLPAGEVAHAQWLHADSLAEYYQVPVFSDGHFKLIEAFLLAAARRSINTVLTPLFTPPLDTAVGSARTPVQLVEVTVQKDRYQFDFSLLRRWVKLCKDCGMRIFEMAPLFSQWGAAHPPQIMATVEGETQQIFGWEDAADGEGYREFLAAFLPKLDRELRYLGIEKNCVFHISDEPGMAQLQAYETARQLVQQYLGDYPIVEAISDFGLYEKGVVVNPVVANDALAPFLEKEVPNLWTYYCCGQSVDVSNCFFAMPSFRNRILGVQMYLYDIKGFLHWGYNFYRTQGSTEAVNPYAVTDAGEAFPSGDAFLVYPGPDGQPEESLRLMVLSEAFQDIRALKLLEARQGRAEVVALIRSKAGMDLSFSAYPNSDGFLIDLRDAVNRALAAPEAEETEEEDQ